MWQILESRQRCNSLITTHLILRQLKMEKNDVKEYEKAKQLLLTEMEDKKIKWVN